MHDRQHGKHVFECDSCGETFEAESEEFSDAWNEAKRDGWRAEKVGVRDWIHGCENCGTGGRR